jgi:hypothetical protein
MVLTSTMAAHYSSNVALIGTCATCAVKVEGEMSTANCRDNARQLAVALSFSYIKPSQEKPNSRFRQCESNKDGFWGQGSQIVWTPEG